MRKCWIIYNPVSGKKKFQEALNIVSSRIKQLGYEITIKPTERQRHAVDLVKEACIEKIDMLLISGGDGTMNEVINGLAESSYKPKIAYIPSGTACDIAKTLGIPKDIEKALKIIENDHAVYMDIVKSSHGYFMYVTAIGNYVDISYVTQTKLKKIFGYGAYLFTGIKEFFTIPMIKTEIIHDHGKLKGYYSLMLVVNSKRVAGFNIISKPLLDDGKVDIVVYRYIPLINNIIYFFSFFFNPRWLPGVQKIQTTHAKIYTEHHRKWNIDGEAADSGNQEVKVIPQHVKIIVNEKKTKKYFKHQPSNEDKYEY